ncbi:serine hydrolase domain-containing protein [Rubinisphaera margarita]|uniref:serine hydrolase domain-containing protein n=1 Tax=Rubinisphaera margarita TaxID=2909586 RepID=UPI001EE8D431|nr:serine hydrolase domain-containing protein [Rubinisphaera margarita]MCG6155564.1 beta-lactamase family protein [Rubinisphaera margarita]
MQCPSLSICFGFFLGLTIAFANPTATRVHGEETSEIPRTGSTESRLSADQQTEIDQVVKEGIENGQMPGCVVLIGHRGKIVLAKAYGHRQSEPEAVPMTLDTVFDLASLTKPVATATSILHLVEQGKLKLDQKVTAILPTFTGNGKENITVRQLLIHQSGLIADNSIHDYGNGPQQAFERIDALKLTADPGTKFIYSDVGFIVLGRIVEAVSGTPLNEYAAAHIFKPTGMQETGYLPDKSLHSRTAPTEQRNGDWMRGEVHDPRAYALNGVAGHAGLFSTAEDLARYATMMLNGGTIDRQRVLKPETIELMITPHEVSRGVRGLGWDIQSPYSSNRGDQLSERAFGHGGFTGTVLWIDPDQDLFFIFLSNRLHPDGEGSVNSLAGRIISIAAAALSSTE